MNTNYSTDNSFASLVAGQRPWTVVFYSFRGGVGRTTLLVSTLKTIAEFPHFLVPQVVGIPWKPETHPNVGIVDFDLEAPGIDSFDMLKPPNPDGQNGLLEYIDEYTKNKNQPSNLPSYWYQKELTRPEGAGSIRSFDAIVMRAGLPDKEYVKRLSRLDLERLYQTGDGYMFFENMRAGFKSECGCDYLLVDSRTGFTEIGGVCLGHLADAAVLVFQPTTAYARGLPEVVSSIRKREEIEGRYIPRLYIATKSARAVEYSFADEAIRVAKAIVQECEGSDRSVDIWPCEWSQEFDFWTHRLLDTTYVGMIPNYGMHQLGGDTSTPDAYLPNSGRSPSTLSGEFQVAYQMCARFLLESKETVVKDWIRRRAISNGKDRRPLGVDH